jgi:radical SAM superfamily enzyme YgiQ (UPF0313 family)
MRRPYDVDKLKSLIEYYSVSYPSLKILIHLITGFPGETEEQFEELVTFEKWFMKQNPLHMVQPFPYAKSTKNTIPSGLAELPQRTIQARYKKLLRIYRKTVIDFYRKSVGNSNAISSKLAYTILLALDYSDFYLGELQRIIREKQHRGGKRTLYRQEIPASFDNETVSLTHKR